MSLPQDYDDWSKAFTVPDTSEGDSDTSVTCNECGCGMEKIYGDRVHVVLQCNGCGKRERRDQ